MKNLKKAASNKQVKKWAVPKKVKPLPKLHVNLKKPEDMPLLEKYVIKPKSFKF